MKELEYTLSGMKTMGKLIRVLLLVACFLPCVYGQKTRLSQQPKPPKPIIVYPLKIHISGIHLRSVCSGGGCSEDIYADAVIDGKKVDLRGNVQKFSTGDYPARLRNPEPNTNPTDLGAKYEIIFPDGTVWRCTVSGFSE